MILAQLLRTDKNVTFLHPLIDLLNLPEDQREALGDRLAQLLADLNGTLRHHQEQQREMIDQLTGVSERMTTQMAAIKEQQAQQTLQMNQILKILGQPLD
ncbi:MAG: hypothetical protein ACEPO2_00970 [Pelagibaca sp.]